MTAATATRSRPTKLLPSKASPIFGLDRNPVRKDWHSFCPVLVRTSTSASGPSVSWSTVWPRPEGPVGPQRWWPPPSTNKFPLLLYRRQHSFEMLAFHNAIQLDVAFERRTATRIYPATRDRYLGARSESRTVPRQGPAWSRLTSALGASRGHLWISLPWQTSTSRVMRLRSAVAMTPAVSYARVLAGVQSKRRKCEARGYTDKAEKRGIPLSPLP